MYITKTTQLIDHAILFCLHYSSLTTISTIVTMIIISLPMCSNTLSCRYNVHWNSSYIQNQSNLWKESIVYNIWSTVCKAMLFFQSVNIHLFNFSLLHECYCINIICTCQIYKICLNKGTSSQIYCQCLFLFSAISYRMFLIFTRDTSAYTMNVNSLGRDPFYFSVQQQISLSLLFNCPNTS